MVSKTNIHSLSSISDQKKQARSDYRWLVRYAKPVKFWVYLSIIIGLFSGVLLITQAGLIAYLIAMAARGTISTLPYSFLLCLLAVIIGRSVLSWLAAVVGCHTAIQVKKTIRAQLTRVVDQLQYRSTIKLDRVGVVNQVLGHVESLHDFFAVYLPQMSIAVMLPLVIALCVFPLSWVSGLILLLTAPLIPLFMALVGMGAESVHQKQFQSLTRLGQSFLNTLQGLTTLKLFGRSKAQSEQVYRAAEEYRQRTMAVLKVAFLSSAVLELLSSVAIAIIAVYLGLVLLGLVHFGASNGISLFSALFILLLAPEFYAPLRKLGTYYHAKSEAMAATEKIRQFLNQEILVEPRQENLLVMPLLKRVALRCDKLSFGYEKAFLTLDELSLSVCPGEVVAIAGASGVGKSTLLKLLMGLRQPTSGKIWVNETDLSTVTPESWMRSVAWLSQGTRLLPGTIRSNLLVAKPRASEVELFAALKQAKALEFVLHLPQGLDTVMAEDNSGFSGGELQRLAIARLYLKRAPLLLLDEPTASIDAKTEQLVLAGLKNVINQSTVIMVSHRPATLALADQIYVLNSAGKLNLIHSVARGEGVW